MGVRLIDFSQSAKNKAMNDKATTESPGDDDNDSRDAPEQAPD
ncbi:MAG: hypothetical protein R3C19_19600 [Planctomycetaceae bacterium]